MRVTLRMKLLSAFGLVAVLTLLLGIFSISQLQSVNGSTVEMATKILPAVSYVGKIDADIADVQRLLYRHLLETDSAPLAQIEQDFRTNSEDLAKQLELYAPTVGSDPRERELFDSIKRGFQSYRSVAEQVLALSRQAKNAEAMALDKRVIDPILGDVNSKIDDLLKFNLDEAAVASKHAAATFRLTLAMTIGIVALAFLASLIIGLFLAQMIVTNVAVIAKAADGLALGDLNQTVSVASRDELGDMADSFKRMMAYIQGVASVAERVAEGDLMAEVQPKGEGDVLSHAILRMVGNLRGIVGRVRAAADSVGSSASELSSSSEELSRTVAVQASSAEETSATMEEMAANTKSVDQSAQSLGEKVGALRRQSDEVATAVQETGSAISELAASVQQVAGNVAHANEASDLASQAAQAGEKAVDQTISGMQAISETMQGIRKTIQTLDQRSGEIGTIIEVIDDIAEQTNLLALNAAIEAARAGDAGRGFAVVADEVRKLAERSAKATSEIASLIKSIQHETTQAVGVTQEGAVKVDEGAQLVTRTGDALKRIKEASGQVASLLGEVAGATNEQARASQQIVQATEQMASVNRQVTQGVAEMDHIAQQVTYATREQTQGTDQIVMAVESISRSSQEAATATATQQVSQMAGDLSRQAHELQEAVAFFKLADDKGLARVIAPRALPART